MKTSADDLIQLYAFIVQLIFVNMGHRRQGVTPEKSLKHEPVDCFVTTLLSSAQHQCLWVTNVPLNTPTICESDLPSVATDYVTHPKR